MIGHLLRPAAICLIGASGDPGKLAGKTLVRLEQHRYAGAVYLVNPRYDAIGGRRCFASVTEIGQPIDVALIAVPAKAVPAAVRECGRAGVGHAVVISSGFGEDSAAGALAEELADAVRESGVRLVGPNCEGIWSTPADMALTFGSAADRPRLIPGRVSVISQSGSIGGACMRRLQDLELGCRYFISSGNETDLTAMDFLEHLVDEGGSDVIAMFVEGLRDGHRLREIARRAAASGVRLIALCAGSSELGRLATASHTGRIASAASVYRDLLRTCGVVQVDTFAQFVDAIRVACSRGLGQTTFPEDAQRGVGVVALSGGSRALLADSCSRLQVPLATFAPSTESTLEGLLPRFGFSKNPTDLTGQVVSDPQLFADVIRTVADDPHTEALVIQYANGADAQLLGQVGLFEELLAQTPLPIVVSLLGGIEAATMVRLQQVGVLCAEDPQEAVEGLGWLYRWREATECKAQQPDDEPADGEPMSTATWPEQMDLLAHAGIDAPGWRIWEGVLTETMDGLEFPVVVKALPELADHKTEAGLVFLGLHGMDDLASALEHFARRAPAGAPALIQEMVPATVEVLLTARHDPDFGPVLALGSGGVQTEWLRDLVHVQLPATEDEILLALKRLRLWELLQPFRGRPARDVAALVAAARRLGEVYLRHLPVGSEVEINPLMVGEQGEGVVAVDILCTTPGASEPTTGALS